MTEQHTVTLEHWTRHRQGESAERFSLLNADSNVVRTFWTEIEARRFAREMGWTIAGGVQDEPPVRGVFR